MKGIFFEFVKENLLIELKYLKEYKINVYYSIFLSFVFSVSIMFFLKIFIDNFRGVIPWGFREFFYFVFMTSFVKILANSLWGNLNLSQFLLRGEFNEYLSRPVSVFLFYFFRTISLYSSLHALLYFVFILIFVFVYFDSIIFFKLFLSFIFSLVGGVFTVVLFRFIDSFGFFAKGFEVVILDNYWQIYNIFDIYPAIIFDGFYIKKLILLFPSVFFGAYSTHFLFGYMSYYVFFGYFFVLVLLIAFFVFFIKVLWFYGLRNYEGFN